MRRQEATAFVSQYSSGFSCLSVGTVTFLTTSRCTIAMCSTRGPVCGTAFFPSIAGRGASPSPLIQPEDSDGLPSGPNYSSTQRINNLHDNRLRSLMPSHTSLRLQLNLEWQMEQESVRMKQAPFIWTCVGHPSHTATSSFWGRADTLLTHLLCKATWFIENITPIHLKKCRQLSAAKCKGLQLTIPFGTVLCGLAEWTQVILRLQ